MRRVRQAEEIPQEARANPQINWSRDFQKKLEKHFKDMQDFEFTIENEKLYMLQRRTF